MSERDLAIFQSVERLIKRLQAVNRGATEEEIVGLLEKTLTQILSSKVEETPPAKPA